MIKEYQQLLSDSTFFEELKAYEEEQGEIERALGCRHEGCDGELDRAYYPRRPRGLGTELSRIQARRVSFCCREDGCRRRYTPESLLYLRNKVYAFVAVLLTLCLRSGRDPKVTLRKAAALCGAGEVTVRRWRGWMLKFLDSPAWQLLRTRFSAQFSEEQFPLSLLDETRSTGVTLRQAVVNMLRFISLLSTQAVT